MREGSVTFQFDARKLIAGLTSREAREAITAIAIPIIERSWRRVAKRRLSPRRAAVYTEAITVLSTTGTRASLMLDGSEANAIEYGTDRWDMKPGLLYSDKAREDKEGNPYMRVPMMHASARAAGAAAQPMGAPYRRKLGKDAAFELGKQIYARASKMSVGETLRGTNTPKLRERHKGPIYEGMRKERDSKIKGKQKFGIGATQYKTYRTVSLASPASSWWYPKRAGAKLIDEALEDAAPEIQKGINSIVGGMMVRVKLAKVGK